MIISCLSKHTSHQFLQMGQQGMGALSAELSSEIIQIQRPHKSATKFHVLHVLDLFDRRNWTSSFSLCQVLGTPFVRCEGFIYLSLITFLVIKSHPLIVFAGIWNFLVIDPLNGGALQEITDLKGGRGKKQNKTFEYLKSHFLHSHSQASHFIGPHSRTRIRLLG